ncbi:TIGR04086 family membrane protein [Clostridium bovifaecis]|uniref:TIGR04086 family membrane protein n=1 Tax=Clostridium bovifaecis TaxID=2184719 RepID=A0A6I6F178_9CLOT|nr:TIGR04086 family membrane protein [Clostridium bovifaecis]
MEEKGSIICIGQGVVRGFFLTLALLIIYAIVTYFLKSNPKIDSIYFVVITAFSVMYGSIYSVKKIQKRGWLIGLTVAIVYMLVVFLVSAVNGRGFDISSYGILRIALALFVGTLSGMLGINI